MEIKWCQDLETHLNLVRVFGGSREMISIQRSLQIPPSPSPRAFIAACSLRFDAEQRSMPKRKEEEEEESSRETELRKI